jgi:hypothetical protein
MLKQERDNIRDWPRSDYLTQSKITEKMRAIIIDWLMDVHRKWKLKPQSLFLAVSIIDRYLKASLLHKNVFNNIFRSIHDQL